MEVETWIFGWRSGEMLLEDDSCPISNGPFEKETCLFLGR